MNPARVLLRPGVPQIDLGKESCAPTRTLAVRRNDRTNLHDLGQEPLSSSDVILFHYLGLWCEQLDIVESECAKVCKAKTIKTFQHWGARTFEPTPRSQRQVTSAAGSAPKNNLKSLLFRTHVSEGTLVFGGELKETSFRRNQKDKLKETIDRKPQTLTANFLHGTLRRFGVPASTILLAPRTSLSCSVTLEKKEPVFWAWTIFSGAATKKRKQQELVPLNN